MKKLWASTSTIQDYKDLCEGNKIFGTLHGVFRPFLFSVHIKQTSPSFSWATGHLWLQPSEWTPTRLVIGEGEQRSLCTLGRNKDQYLQREMFKEIKRHIWMLLGREVSWHIFNITCDFSMLFKKIKIPHP